LENFRASFDMLRALSAQEEWWPRFLADIRQRRAAQREHVA